MAVLIDGSFTAVGSSASTVVFGEANLFIDMNGAIGDLVLERSFDGVNFFPLSTNITGDIAAWTANFNGTFSELEASVQYRLTCVRYVSGTITYRIGQ